MRLEARVGIEPTHKGFADPDQSIFNFFISSTSLQIVHPFVRFWSALVGDGSNLREERCNLDISVISGVDEKQVAPQGEARNTASMAASRIGTEYGSEQVPPAS